MQYVVFISNFQKLSALIVTIFSKGTLFFLSKVNIFELDGNTDAQCAWEGINMPKLSVCINEVRTLTCIVSWLSTVFGYLHMKIPPTKLQETAILTLCVNEASWYDS